MLASVINKLSGQDLYVLLNTKEDTLHVQVHDLVEGVLRGRVERCAPRSTGVREQDVDVVGVLGHFSNQAFDLRWFGDIGWHGNGFAWERKRIEGGACFFAGGGFAGCDEDFRGAGLDEAVGCEFELSNGTVS